jgi:hypothetical protein
MVIHLHAEQGTTVASIISKETFTYTLNDQNGHTDTATLTINMNPQMVSTVDAVIAGSVYGDTLIYHLLNANDATGGNGTADTWTNFSLAQGDKIDIGDLLVGWNGQNATLGNYLTVTTSGNNTVIPSTVTVRATLITQPISSRWRTYTPRSTSWCNKITLCPEVNI